MGYLKSLRCRKGLGRGMRQGRVERGSDGVGDGLSRWARWDGDARLCAGSGTRLPVRSILVSRTVCSRELRKPAVALSLACHCCGHILALTAILCSSLTSSSFVGSQGYKNSSQELEDKRRITERAWECSGTIVGWGKEIQISYQVQFYFLIGV